MNERIIKIALVLSVTAFALAGVAALALSSSAATQGGNTNSAGGNNNAGGNQGGGSAGAGGTLNRMDRDFFMRAAMSGMKEVELSRLAAERATRADVKEFARRMVEDHTRANEQLMSLAASKGVTLPSAPDAKLRSTLTKLGQRTGADFDRAYLKEAGAPEHEKAVRLFQREASGGGDPEVRAFASAQLPALQEHLNMARALEGGNRAAASAHGANH
ncbi:MAG TPA: DUF4142 domain-containing protein [Pyrinomonadaceae bacterium]|nr:DUF4142 domain-containing protein [Pyrinomonadaceae bacterium]